MDLFRNPIYLVWAILFLGGATALRAWSEARRRKFLAAFGLPATLSRLIPPEMGERRRAKFLLQAAGGALLFVALAGPQWGVELMTTESLGTHVVVAVDTSLSMLAEDAPNIQGQVVRGVPNERSSDVRDVQPSRIEKAKRELLQIIEGLRGERVGIVAFAGEAHVQCPLTTDVGAAKMFLDYVRVGMIPQPGTAIGQAIALGTRMLSKYAGHKAIVLLTDGEDRRGNPLDAARKAAASNIHLYIVGMGTPEGSPIPIRDAQGRTTAYLKDRDGKTVVSKLEEAGSIQLAAATGGAYYRATPEEAEAQKIVQQISGLEKSRIQSSSMSRYKNRYRLPLGLGLMCLLIELLLPERKKREREKDLRLFKAAAPAALALLALPWTSGCGRGRSAADLWRGNRAYAAQAFDQALARYSDAFRKNPRDARPVFNAGDAQYKLGQFDEAARNFSALAHPGKVPARVAPKAFYNLGNSHYRKNEYKEAAEAYKRCLLLDPTDEDCRYNLLKTLQQLKNPKSSQKKQDQKNQPQQQPQQQKSGGDDKKSQDQKPAPPRPQSGLSREDAERILQAVRERQKGLPQPKPSWQKESKPPTEEVDW